MNQSFCQLERNHGQLSICRSKSQRWAAFSVLAAGSRCGHRSQNSKSQREWGVWSFLARIRIPISHVREERPYFQPAHLPWMPHVVKEDKLTNPVDVRFLRTKRIVLHTELLPHLVQEF